MLDPTALVDLNDQDLVVYADRLGNAPFEAALPQLEAAIRAARNLIPDSPWTGPGITSSAARSNPLFTLALIPNRNDDGTPALAQFRDLTVTSDHIFILYTLAGDSDFDGRITLDDYARLDAGYAGGLAGYHHGDFNYDGSIDPRDYDLINAAFAYQQSVPEPLSVLSIALGTLLARRQRPRQQLHFQSLR